MGLLNKLIDKIIDGIKKRKVDSVIAKLAKDNPDFAKSLKRHRATAAEIEVKLQKILKQKGLKP